jgi:hypothetical protein
MKIIGADEHCRCSTLTRVSVEILMSQTLAGRALNEETKMLHAEAALECNLTLNLTLKKRMELDHRREYVLW